MAGFLLNAIFPLVCFSNLVMTVEIAWQRVKVFFAFRFISFRFAEYRKPQQKTWSLYDHHHLQRCSARFYYINFRVTSRLAWVHTNLRQNLPINKLSKHGITTLVLPSRLFYTDLTVNMDVETNPGPEVLRNDKTPQRISTLHNPPVNYSRSQL